MLDVPTGDISRASTPLCAIFVKVGAPNGEIRPDRNLEELGLTSMDMVNLMLAVEAEFDLTIPDRNLCPRTFAPSSVSPRLSKSSRGSVGSRLANFLECDAFEPVTVQTLRVVSPSGRRRVALDDLAEHSRETRAIETVRGLFSMRRARLGPRSRNSFAAGTENSRFRRSGIAGRRDGIRAPRCRRYIRDGPG